MKTRAPFDPDNGVHPVACARKRWDVRRFVFLWPLQELTMHSNTPKTSNLSRRSLIKGAAALGGASVAGGMWPVTASAQGAALETKAAKLGFIALTDAAPLFVADEK